MGNNQYGVSAIKSTNAARPLQMKSTCPIAAAVTSAPYDAGTGLGLDPGLHFFSSVRSAEKVLGAATSGAINYTVNSVVDGISKMNVTAPLFLSVAAYDATPATQEVNIIAALTAIKSGQVETADPEKAVSMQRAGVPNRPDIIIAPFFSESAAVAGEMLSVADALRAAAYVDLAATTELEAVTERGNYGSERIEVFFPRHKVAVTDSNPFEFAPSSIRQAAMRVWTDAQREYGWSDSRSNRVFFDVIGLEYEVEFYENSDCMADRLRSSQINTTILDAGYRSWGDFTTSTDQIWQSAPRVRTFDRLITAGLGGVKWAIDRNALNVLKPAKDSVENMLRALLGAQVLLGYNVYFDEDMMTEANVTAGKFYLVAELMNTPQVTRLEINFTYVDNYVQELINIINA